MEVLPVVLVTGAAQRIGREIVLDLAAHGWQVAVHYRHSASAAAETVAAVRAAGGQAMAFAADLSVETECEALVPTVVQALGRIDAVVNNASLFEYDDVAGFSVAAMERHWRANTAPAILLARALHAAGGGVVVNLLDQKLFNLNPDYLSYSLSKAALQAATTMLAQALAPTVRVCGVAPGLTLGSELIDNTALADLQQASPLQRLPQAADVAQAVRFILQCDGMTGSTVIVDAGQHLGNGRRDFAFQPKGPRR